MHTSKSVMACFVLMMWIFLAAGVATANTAHAATDNASGLFAGESAVLATESMTPTAQAAVEPSTAQVRKLDGTEVELGAPLSIQGDLEAGCGWRFLALDTTQIREIQRQEDGRYILIGDEGELTVSAGWSAVFGKGDWGYERIPIVEVESIRFEGGSPGTLPQATLHWSVTDDCGQETRLACPSDVDWTTATCLPDDVPAAYRRFQLNVQPGSIASVTRAEDAASEATLRLAGGTELDGVAFAEDVALTGQTQFGHLAIPLAQVRALAPDPAPVPATTAEPAWEILDTSGGVLPAVEVSAYHVPIRDDDKGLILLGSLGEFRLTLNLSQLQALRRDPAGSESFTLLDANGVSWPGLIVDPDQELKADGLSLGYTLAISDALGVRALNPPPPTIDVELAWIVTDTLGSALPVISLAYRDGVWAGSDSVMVSFSSLDSARAISPTQEGLSLAMQPPLAALEVVSGTLSGKIAPGQGFAIPVHSVAAVERLHVPDTIAPVTQIGVIRLKGGLELPASSGPSLGYGGRYSVQSDLVEYELDSQILEDRGFHVTDDTIELSCTVSGACPRGRLMFHEGSGAFGDHYEASWSFGDGLFRTPWPEIEGYVPAELPPLEDFAPTAVITVTGWQDETAAFLVRDVRFMQTRRLSSGWCCASPTKYEYPAMNVIEAGGGVTRTVEVEALAAIEFDAEYGRSDDADVLPMHLISRKGGTLDVRLDPAAAGHPFYWDRKREGLIADVGGGLKVIIPFRNAKRIELGWLD